MMQKNFTVSPRVLSHFGEDLIKNESIALLELVKNSYDACATECTVKFNINPKGELSEIEIIDNGLGMDLTLIENVWLKIGTDYKVSQLHKPSICNRLPLGEKGIGRFGIHKLGNEISLVSKAARTPEVSLFIDWTKLKLAKSINDFKIQLTENQVANEFTNSTGTKITIKKLKAKWDRKQIREVYRALVSLNSPFSDTDENFKVKITGGGEFLKGLPTFNEIKDSALYYGKVLMDGDKIIKFLYEFKPWNTLSKIEGGRLKKTEDLNKSDIIIVDSSKEKNRINLNQYSIGPIEFDVIIFEKDLQMLNYAIAEKKIITTYLSENGGIRVYRDGIRVYDYGEKENDWLGIDLKRVSKVGGRVSNNILLGSVKLKREFSSGLKEKTNREGFIENENYHAFVEAVDYVLSLVVRERNHDKSKLTTLYKKSKVIEPVLSDLDNVIKIVEETSIDADDKLEILKYLDRVGSQYKDVKEILIRSANAGLNLSVVVHQIEKLVSQLIRFIENRDLQKAVEISKLLENIVRGYMVMVKKSSILNNKLSTIAAAALDNYAFRFSDHKISVISNHKNSKLIGRCSEAESVAALTNLLDNSIYWISYSNESSRKISVFLTDQIGGYNSIIVSDNGPGFNIPFEVAIEPFITGKPHNIGSGIGLHVINEMMKAMNGKLICLDLDEINLPSDIVNQGITSSILALCFIKK